MHKEHLEIAAIDAVDAGAAIRRGEAVAGIDRNCVVLQRRLLIEPGAIDGSKCFALQRCRAAARHTASLRVSDASLRVSDASLRVSDASLRLSDASLRVSDASLRLSDASLRLSDASLRLCDASLRLCHFILTSLEPSAQSQEHGR